MTEILREVALTGGAVEIRGALEVVETSAGVLPRRLPEWTRPQHQDPGMELMATSASGVRMAFRTAATVVELDVLTTVPVIAPAWQPGDAPPETDAGYFDLCVDGVVVAKVPAPVGRMTVLEVLVRPGRSLPGGVGRVRFELEAGAKEVEIWLPQWVACELVALRADAPVEPPAPTGRPVWLHHGSSISQCNGADSPTSTWPAVVARRAGLELVNVGLAGNCFLDPFVARSVRDTAADVISFKLGVNLTRRGSFDIRSFGPAVHGFLDTVRDGHPDAPIVVVSPIACPESETVPPNNGAGTLTLQTVRSELRRVVAVRAQSDPALFYLDGLELLGPHEAGLLPDGLHPNQAGNDLIGERFATAVWGVDGVLGRRGGGVTRPRDSGASVG